MLVAPKSLRSLQMLRKKNVMYMYCKVMVEGKKEKKIPVYKKKCCGGGKKEELLYSYGG